MKYKIPGRWIGYPETQISLLLTIVPISFLVDFPQFPFRFFHVFFRHTTTFIFSLLSVKRQVMEENFWGKIPKF